MSLMEHYQSTRFEGNRQKLLLRENKTQGHWPEKKGTGEKAKEPEDKVPRFSPAQNKPQVHLMLLDKATK